jgi:peptide deformylase
MSILKIARMGHPVLAQPAAAVADPRDPEIARLVGDMLETLEDIGGLGLAAPQVHVPKRVVIFHLPPARAAVEDGPAGAGVAMTVLVNPEIEPVGEEMSLGWEGCLSVPGLRGLVPRHQQIRYRWRDLEGRQMEQEAEGMHARVVQHECDHLDGVLYPQRMTDMRWLVFESEMKHAMAALEAAAE